MVVDRTNPWVLPSLHELEVPLSAMEISYQAIVHTVVDPILVPLTASEEPEESYLPAWEAKSLHSRDCLDMDLPLDESILKSVCRQDKIREDLHH